MKLTLKTALWWPSVLDIYSYVYICIYIYIIYIYIQVYIQRDGDDVKVQFFLIKNNPDQFFYKYTFYQTNHCHMTLIPLLQPYGYLLTSSPPSSRFET